jgi:flagellar biogenesis protein FliO
MSTTFMVAISIAVAAVTIYGLTRAFGPERGRGGEDASDDPAAPEIRVLSRERVSRGNTLVIVEVEGRRLLLGSTRSQWCALADLGPVRSKEEADLFAPFDAELTRAMNATRFRRGGKRS